MEPITAKIASSRVANEWRQYISLLRVAKRDSAGALSWQLPVPPHEAPTSFPWPTTPAAPRCAGCCGRLEDGPSALWPRLRASHGQKPVAGHLEQPCRHLNRVFGLLRQDRAVPVYNLCSLARKAVAFFRNPFFISGSRMRLSASRSSHTSAFGPGAESSTSCASAPSRRPSCRWARAPWPPR